MIRLSVNVNKVATLRNARGGNVAARVLDAVATCLNAGAQGASRVHPRADRRHITPDDVREIAAALEGRRPGVEYNIEGDARDELIALVHEVAPDQCTLVPVAPGEITSQAGWRPGADSERLRPVIAAMKARGTRVSLFVDPDDAAIELAASLGADRVELYTEPILLRAFERGADTARRSFELYAGAARAAHAFGLGVNAGHDLDLDNLALFRTLPHLDEVSIGQRTIMSRALFRGLDAVVREDLGVLV